METQNLKNYRNDIDLLKGLAIIAIVLYHIGFIKTGYLGVDIFFVINGFFILPSLCSKIILGEFRLIQFFKKRIIRMYPLLIVVCLVSLCLGFFTMFPDDLNTLAESVIATLTFSNNLLAFYLTRDYWDWTNDFKPLMHTWYLGVLFQIYLLIILLFLPCKHKFGAKNIEKKLKMSIWVLGSISLFLFLVPAIDKNIKFYFIPFRIFEFCFGGLAGIYDKKIILIMQKNLCRYCHIILYCIDLLVISALFVAGVWNIDLSNTYLLIVVVFTTCLCLISGKNIRFPPVTKPLAIIGKASYSIFLWHQVILAFFRQCFSVQFSLRNILLYVIILAPFVLLSYFKIEKKKNPHQLSLYLFPTALLMIISFGIWTQAGIVRDIPELEIKKGNVERRKFPHYVDRIYDYNRDFPDSDTNTVNVLLIGNSYARDFANILLESKMNNRIAISYLPGISSDCGNGELERITNSDYIFVFLEKTSLPAPFWNNVSDPQKVYGIGTKNFGDCNGIVYNSRFWTEDIHAQYAIVQKRFSDEEEKLQKQWGDHYISILSYAKNDDGTVRIFTDDNKFISYDCYHLSPAGAKYFALKIDWDSIFVDD